MKSFPTELTITIQVKTRCQIEEEDDAVKYLQFLGFRVCNWNHNNDETVTIEGVKKFVAQKKKDED